MPATVFQRDGADINQVFFSEQYTLMKDKRDVATRKIAACSGFVRSTVSGGDLRREGENGDKNASVSYSVSINRIHRSCPNSTPSV